jgi:type IV pilus assembly protein PilM
MGWMGAQSRSAIGIDLGACAVKAVQLGRARGGWSVVAAVSTTLPNHPLDRGGVRFLRDTLVRQGFTTQRVVLAAPTAQLEVDVLELPPRTSGAPLEQIARVELARGAKLENNLFELSCWDLPAPARAATAGTVMAVALRHEHASALLDPFQAEGFDVVAIDTRSWAMARAAASQLASDGITALLDIGFGSALMVLVHNGVVVYQRVLRESGVGIVLRALRDEFQLADDEAEHVLRNVGLSGRSEQATAFAQADRIVELVQRYVDAMLAEIQPAFDYASHRYAESPLRSLLMCGGGAGIPGLGELLSSRISLPTSVLCPARIVECTPAIAPLCADPALTTALGLAWHQVR